MLLQPTSGSWVFLANSVGHVEPPIETDAIDIS